MVDVYSESYFHSLLLPLNFRSANSAADFSEGFQEPRAQHEFKCFAGLNSNHLAEMSPSCFGNRLRGLCLGNSSLFCSCWNQTSPLKEGNYFKPAMEHSTAYTAQNSALGLSPFRPASPFCPFHNHCIRLGSVSTSSYSWVKLVQEISWSDTVFPNNFIQSHMPLILINNVLYIHGLSNTRNTLTLLSFVRELSKAPWSCILYLNVCKAWSNKPSRNWKGWSNGLMLPYTLCHAIWNKRCTESDAAASASPVTYELALCMRTRPCKTINPSGSRVSKVDLQAPVPVQQQLDLYRVGSAVAWHSSAFQCST